MVRSCSAYGCTNSTTHRKTKENDIKFFKFPLTNKELLNLWVLKVRRKDWTPTKNSVLCSCHFATECIVKKGIRNRLVTNSVPTLFSFTKSQCDEQNLPKHGNLCDQTTKTVDVRVPQYGSRHPCAIKTKINQPVDVGVAQYGSRHPCAIKTKINQPVDVGVAQYGSRRRCAIKTKINQPADVGSTDSHCESSSAINSDHTYCIQDSTKGVRHGLMQLRRLTMKLQSTKRQLLREIKNKHKLSRRLEMDPFKRR